MQEKERKKSQEKRIILAFLREQAGVLLWVVFFIGIFCLLCFLENVPQDVTVYTLQLAFFSGIAVLLFRFIRYRKRFQIMQKVGMSRQEVRQTIRSQVITVFFLPLAVAILHTIAAFPVTRQLMTMMNFPDSGIFLVATAVTIVAFAIVYLIVYAITARAYYKIVE